MSLWETTVQTERALLCTILPGYKRRVSFWITWHPAYISLHCSVLSNYWLKEDKWKNIFIHSSFCCSPFCISQTKLVPLLVHPHIHTKQTLKPPLQKWVSDSLKNKTLTCDCILTGTDTFLSVCEFCSLLSNSNWMGRENEGGREGIIQQADCCYHSNRQALYQMSKLNFLWVFSIGETREKSIS